MIDKNNIEVPGWLDTQPSTFYNIESLSGLRHIHESKIQRFCAVCHNTFSKTLPNMLNGRIWHIGCHGLGNKIKVTLKVCISCQEKYFQWHWYMIFLRELVY